jgi:predicted DNA binding CopG/RHH family protein
MARTSFPGESGFKYLDEEERALIEGTEASADTLQPLPKAEKDAFLAQFRKAGSVRKNVTMRMDESTIAGLKAKAEAEGLPYQTSRLDCIRKLDPIRRTLGACDLHGTAKLFDQDPHQRKAQ